MKFFDWPGLAECLLFSSSCVRVKALLIKKTVIAQNPTITGLELVWTCCGYRHEQEVVISLSIEKIDQLRVHKWQGLLVF